jgi:hypothetical protein
MSTLPSGGSMTSKNLHNELYKLAIAMAKYNGKGVKQNLDYLLSQEQVRNKDNNDTVQQSLPILCQYFD